MELLPNFSTLVSVDITNEPPDDSLITNQPEAIMSVKFPSPNNPPWNSWVALGVWFASVVFVVFIPALFLLPYLEVKGILSTDSGDLKGFIYTDETAIFLQLAPIILAHLLTLALAWFVVTRAKTYPFRETLGWEWNGFKIWHAVVIFFGFYAFALLLTSIFGDVENDVERLLKNSRTAVYLFAFFATFTAPVVEEVVYRGLLYSAFQRKFGIVAAVFFVTILFTLVHVPQYSVSSTPDYVTVTALLLISLVLTLIRVKTGNLLPCIVLHTLVNGVQSVVLILEPYLPPTTETAFVRYLIN